MKEIEMILIELKWIYEELEELEKTGETNANINFCKGLIEITIERAKKIKDDKE